MKVTRLELTNVKSFKKTSVNLSEGINIFIGPNNAGKSVIIHSTYLLQKNNPLLRTRLGEKKGEVIISLKDIVEVNYITTFHQNQGCKPKVYVEIYPTGPKDPYVKEKGSTSIQNVSRIRSREPDNFIYPFLSKRKVIEYEEAINTQRTITVEDNFSNLVSKVDRVAKPEYLGFKEYKKSCESVIGFPLSTMASPGGHKIGVPIGKTDSITIETMGEGMPNLAGLITALCLAENKLFLIEEPENDIHPQALKKLLNLIIDKSSSNQFIISTHSNIVTKQLGSTPSAKVFKVSVKYSKTRLPTSKCTELKTPKQRTEALEELGYELADYDLWNAWLILEESTAETIVNDILIPKFTPSLKNKLGTIAAKGIDDVPLKFERLYTDFLFIHLMPKYLNKAWVVVDNDPKGKKVIRKLKDAFAASEWNEDTFQNFSKSNFEEYYPKRFKRNVDKVIKMKHGYPKQEAKKKLLKKVLDWANKNKTESKQQFYKSAREVIKLLKFIEKQVA